VEVRHELYEDAVSRIWHFGAYEPVLKTLFCQIHVFQAYPFLEASARSFMSCREFVRNILPQFQSRSPQPLGGAAEAVLEDEIDNDKACVVSGDGQETATGMQEVNAEFSKEESDSGDDVANPKTYPSWRSSQIWSPSLDGDSDTDDSGSETEITSPPPYQNATFNPVIRRIKSAISVLIPESAPPPVRTRNHHRTPSHQSVLNDSRHHRHRLSISNLALSNSPPPSPSIRRSNVSHPNVTSLIQQWTSSGPANQTLTYKPS
jgi:hypothetical protein